MSCHEWRCQNYILVWNQSVVLYFSSMINQPRTIKKWSITVLYLHRISTVEKIFLYQVSAITWWLYLMLIPFSLLLVGWWLSKYHFDFVVNKFIFVVVHSIQSLFHIIHVYCYTRVILVSLYKYISLHRDMYKWYKKDEALCYFCWILTMMYSTLYEHPETKLNLHSNLAFWRLLGTLSMYIATTLCDCILHNCIISIIFLRWYAITSTQSALIICLEVHNGAIWCYCFVSLSYR